ncbi:MAG: ATPase, T2SS/T4P/T4SS family, partial [Promethearchaeota archaeon]
MEIEEFQLLNPIIMYKKIINIELIAKKLMKNNQNKPVIELILHNINNFIHFFQELKIIQKLIEEKLNFNVQDNELEILLSLLVPKSNSNHLSKNLIEEQVLETIFKEQYVDEYGVGNNEIYHIRIYEIRDETEKYYEIHPFYYFTEEKSYFFKIIDLITEEIDSIEINEIISVENLINKYFHKFKDILKTKYSLYNKNTERIAFLSAIKKINFEKIFPLLMDDYIEEIFLDNPYDFIYINHLKYGRCRTGIRLNSSEIDRFKTFLRLYSGKRLDYSHPSIKYVIKNQFFYCRFSIDINPININGFALDIRKLNKKIFTIQDLLKNETLSPLIAAFLFFLIIKRINITVTGETDTGKTTLINALDLLTPKEFRKIYIENVTESLDQNSFEKHQLKYRVESIEDYPEFRYTKSNQIKKLLHRTPDIIYLGEILTKEEAEAMFHCLSAGLRGFQTIHSNDINSLINRFIYHFNINISCLKDLGIIILMKKLTNERKIISISELSLDLKKEDLSIINLIQYQPKLKNWTQNNSLFESNCVQSLLLFEDLTETKFLEILRVYTEIFK